jgi:DNA-binding Xre family transcriptional regulator
MLWVNSKCFMLTWTCFISGIRVQNHLVVCQVLVITVGELVSYVNTSS